MRMIALIGTLSLASPAASAPRPLTLADAVALAMRVDPMVSEAFIGKDRSKLAVMRAQLDRVSVRIDGSLAEQWNKSNIGGPVTPTCTLRGATLPLDSTTCMGLGGTFSQVASSPEQGYGLFNLSANLNVPIFAGFRIDATVKRAGHLDQAAGVSILQARRDTALATARAYWTVRRLGLLLEVQQASVARLKDSEAVTQARVQAGLAPPIDHNRATLRRLQLEAQLADLAGLLREATVQLAVALEVPDDLVLTDPPDVPEESLPSVSRLIGDAHGGRPEILYSWLQTLAQTQAVRIARSGFYPQFGAQLLFQYGNNPFVSGTGASLINAANPNPFANTSGNLTLSVGLSYNFFDTFHTFTAMRDAQYEELRLQAEEHRAIRLVENDVRLAHAKMNHYLTERTPLLAARDVARDNAQILEARYKNGDALVIEMLDAQVALVDAERALADVTAQLKMAALELDAALGRVVGGEK